MKKNYFALFLGIFYLFPNLVISQQSYIATDTSVSIGIKLISSSAKDNAQFIKLINKDKTITYTPYDLSEYGLNNGDIYISKDTSITGDNKRVFLERIGQGKINLYYCARKGNDIYFIETDSSGLEVISKENSEYKNKIMEITRNYDWELNQIRVARYKKNSLKKLISIYNKGKSSPLPYIRVGITVGVGRSMVKISPLSMAEDLFQNLKFKPSNSFSLGFFTDLPIESSYFSLNTGIVYSKNRYISNYQTDLFVYDANVNLSYFQIPLLFRYTLPTGKLRLFANLGGNYLHHLHNENVIYQTSYNSSMIIIDRINLPDFIGNDSFGITFGSGLQYNLDFRRTVSLEARYNYFVKKDHYAGFKQFSLLVGFSI